MNLGRPHPDGMSDELVTPKDVMDEGHSLAQSLYRAGATKNLDPRANTMTSYVTGFHAGLQWAAEKGHEATVEFEREFANYEGDIIGVPIHDLFEEEDDGSTTVVEWTN